METKVDKKGTIENRIMKIRGHFCYGNNLEFSQKLGVTRTFASSICSGNRIAGKETLEKILEAFPQVNRSWLYFGDGPMLVGEEQKQGEVAVSSDKDALIAELKERIQEQSDTIRTLSLALSQLSAVIESRQKLDKK